MLEFRIQIGEVIDVPTGAVRVLSAEELDEPYFALFLMKEDSDTDPEWKHAVKRHKREYRARLKQIEARKHLLEIVD